MARKPNLVVGGFAQLPTPTGLLKEAGPKKNLPTFQRPIKGAPRGKVRVTSHVDGKSIVAWLTVPFLPTGADVGGWQIAARDGDIGIPEYVGTDPEGWTFSLLFDGWTRQDELRDEVEQLLDFGRKLDRIRPGEVAVTGSVPDIVATRRWLLNGATVAQDLLIDDDDGGLYRAVVACTLLAPVDAKPARAPKLAKADRKKPLEKVKASGKETLLQILARERKTTTGWHAIAELNDIRDPSAIIKKGKVIRIP